MAPPVRQSQSCGGRAGGVARGEQAGGVALVGHDRALGEQRADDLAHRIGGERARWAGRAAPAAWMVAASGAAPTRVGQRGERGGGVAVAAGEHVHRAALGHQVARLVRGRRRTTPATWRRRGSRWRRPSSCMAANSAR